MAKHISPEYQQLLQDYHQANIGWAKSGARFYERARELVAEHKPRSLLDYGCGKGVLVSMLNQSFPQLVTDLYDPGVPEFDHDPVPADMVTCTDVLEHIEPEHIEQALYHLQALTKKVAYFVVHTGDCGHKLPDGRPAHILQRSQQWWMEKLTEVYCPAGFELSFKDTGLPMRFEAVAVRIDDAPA
ncbi:MAG: methyltransferase domain-containing protein [Candidatus Puniceispirillaceae bacterium]